MFIVDDATEGVHPLSPILLLYLFLQGLLYLF